MEPEIETTVHDVESYELNFRLTRVISTHRDVVSQYKLCSFHLPAQRWFAD